MPQIEFSKRKEKKEHASLFFHLTLIQQSKNKSNLANVQHNKSNTINDFRGS